MKKLLSAVMAVCLLFSIVAVGMGVSAEETVPEIWDGSIATSFASGSGTSSNPYIVKNAAQLAYLTNSTSTFSGKYIKLVNDIYLNDTTNWESWKNTAPKNKWTPIGEKADGGFEGVFDGGGYTVYGMYAVGSSYQGLFYKGGTIKNLTVKESYAEGTYSGGISAYDSYVVNCHNFANVRSTDSYAGGICGYSSTKEIEYCSNGGNIYGGMGAGGIAGYSHATIKYCYNTGKISSKNSENGSAGGIAGRYGFTALSETKRYNYYISAQILNCYNCGEVSAWCAGGLLGNSSSFYSSHVSAAKYYTYNSSYNLYDNYIENCYNVGKVTASESGGGVVAKFPLEGETQNFSLFIGDTKNVYYYDSTDKLLAYGNYEKDYATPLTEAEAKQQASYEFDFSQTWTMDGNQAYPYPKLVDNYQSHEHNYKLTETKATCTVDGLKTYTCSCGDTYTETITAPGHTWSEKWYTDNEAHWHECIVDGCGEESEHEQHSGGTATLTDKAICKDCGEEYGKLTAPVISVAPANDTPYVAYGNRDYIVKVIGSPSKIQVVRDNGGTTTVDRRKATVTSDGDTEIWLINIRVEAGTHNMRAKYGNVWHEVSTEFSVAYDMPGAYSFDISYENGTATFNAVTDPEVIKVQFVLDNGCTLTYSQYASKIGEDGLRYWTVSRKVPADIKYTLRTKYGYTWTDTEFSAES